MATLTKASRYAASNGSTARTACRVGSAGNFSSSTMIVITIATTPSVSAFSRVGVMRDPPQGNMTPPGSGSSLADKHECGSAREAGEGADVAPANGFLEHHHGEYCEYRERDDFLGDLQLPTGEAVSVANPIGGH